MPLRDTPTRITSASVRLRFDWPSSCASEVDRLDAILVFLGIRVLVNPAHCVRRLDIQFDLERLDEGLEHVEHERVAALDDLVGRAVHERREDDRAPAIEGHDLVDLLDGGMRLVDGIDERHAHEPELLVELGEDRMRERFGGDPGTVGNDEYGRRHRRVNQWERVGSGVLKR